MKTALLYAVRDLGDEAAARARAPTSRPPTSTRSSRRSPSASSARCAQTGLERLAIGGGVAANGPLRERLARLGADASHVPPRELCTDNAAMIGSAARWRRRRCRSRRYLGLDAYATGERATCERRPGHALRPAGLPPVRRGPRRARARCAPSRAVRAASSVDIEADDATCMRATSSASRSSRSTGEELYDFFVDETDLRDRLLRRRAS